jgi:Tfp pilus assembly protein PilF
VADRDLLFRLLTERGRLYLKANNVPEARRHLREALALQPDSAQTMVHLASCHMLENKAAEATAQLEQALAIDPMYPDALYGMGSFITLRGGGSRPKSCLPASGAETPPT